MKDGCTYLEDCNELVDVVNAFGVELMFEFVSDLFHAVSPVCHLAVSMF
jgi:hypothetical protein